MAFAKPTPNRLRPRHFAFVALLLGTDATAAANILVVRSDGPSARSYPPGRTLPPNARISLRAQDTLVLLDNRGTRRLRGPGTFSAATPASPTMDGNERGTGAGDRRSRLAVVRDTPPNRTVWQVDVSQSSTVCVTDAANIQLWRPAAPATVNLSITPVTDARAHMVQWPAGLRRLAWPAGLVVTNDAEYRLGMQGLPVPTQLRFRILPSEPVGLEATARSLIRNGCRVQLDLLVDDEDVRETVAGR